MILVGQYDSPFVRRVAVTLGLYGVPFTRNAMSVFGDVGEMKRINPLVRIPSLVLDNGETLIDSNMIIDHLDEEAGPAKALTPASGPARRHVLQRVAAATGAIDKAGAVVYERHFHAAAAVNEEWLGRCKDQLAGGLTHLEQALTGDWLYGAKLTQADVTATCLIGYLRLRLPEMLHHGAYPRLERLAATCEAMPAFAAARPSPDEVMPAR